MPAQRYYNLLCMAYGADRRDLRGLRRATVCPQWRAENCGDEYAMLKRAFGKLIVPHIDEAKLREAIGRVRFNWSPLASAREGFDAPPLAD